MNLTYTERAELPEEYSFTLTHVTQNVWTGNYTWRYYILGSPIDVHSQLRVAVISASEIKSLVINIVGDTDIDMQNVISIFSAWLATQSMFDIEELMVMLPGKKTVRYVPCDTALAGWKEYVNERP